MQLIFINRYFWPDQSATSQMLSDVAFALAEAQPGRRVCVITSRQGYEAASERLAADEVACGVRIVRVWTSRFGRHNLLGRAFDYATFYVSAAWTLWRLARRGDVVVVKTDPPLLSVIAGPVAKLRGALLVNWLQDVYPEVAKALAVGGPVIAVFTPVLAGLRNVSLRGAAANVVLGQRMARRVQALGVAADKIVLIPNWADGDLIRPVAREANALRRAWGLEGKFVVAYSGNLGRAHEIATMLEAIAGLERRADAADIAWLFIGGGAQVSAMKREVAARGLKSVSFQPYQPRERLEESLGVGDVHLISLRPELEGLIVPSKVYGVLAAGRPAVCIGDAQGEVAQMLERARCGCGVAQGDPAALARIVHAWAQDRGLVDQMGASARAVFDASCDRRFAIWRWERLLQNIAAGRPVGDGLDGEAGWESAPASQSAKVSAR